MGFVVCLVIGVVLAQVENGKMNGSGTGSGGC